jgi:hypothetical protein
MSHGLDSFSIKIFFKAIITMEEGGGFNDPVEQYHEQANQPPAAAPQEPPIPRSISKVQQRLGPESGTAALASRDAARVEHNRRQMQMRAQQIHPLNDTRPQLVAAVDASGFRVQKNYFKPKLDKEFPGAATKVTLQGKFSDIEGAAKHTDDLELPVTYRDVMYRYVNDKSIIDPRKEGFDGTGDWGVNRGMLNTFWDGKSVWMSRTQEGAENFAREHVNRAGSRVQGTIYKINTKGIPLVDVESLSKNNPDLYHRALSSSQGRGEFDFVYDSPEMQAAMRKRSEAYQSVVALNQEHVALGPIDPDRIISTTRTNMDLPSEWDPKQNPKTAKVQAAMAPFVESANDIKPAAQIALRRFGREMKTAQMRRSLWMDSKARDN